MSKLLLTGASGFLGGYLVDNLKSQFDLVTLGLTSGDNYNVNLSNTVPEFKETFNIVVHAAGKAHVIPKSDLEEKDFYNVNYLGTVNLLKGLEKLDSLPEKFVFISTVAVYGLEYGAMIDELESLKANDAYGKSKRLAEQKLIKWGERNNVIITILRLPLVVGRDAPGNLGEMVTSIKKGRFALVGKGDAKRSMVCAEDVANFIPQLSIFGGIFHLTDGYHPSFKELYTVIKDKVNSPSIPSIPFFIAKLLAYVGDLGESILKKDLPFNSRRYKKMTSSYTFDDSEAQVKGWKPHKVLDVVDSWL